MTNHTKYHMIILLTGTMFLWQFTNCSSDSPKANDFKVKTEKKADTPKAEKKEAPKETSEMASTETEVVKEDAQNLSNKGIGPIKSLELGAIDQAMVAAGKIVFKEKCTACHKPTRRFVGPAPKGIMDRRSPEWIMNMILNPEQMVKEDPDAEALMAEYNYAPMANQNLTEEEARQILEYFRTL